MNQYDFTMPSCGHYLACMPVAVELPEGLKACVVGEAKVLNYEGTDYTYAVLDEVEGNVVPARMPVVLVGEAGKHTLKFIANDNTKATTPNLLKGAALKQTGISRATLLYSATATSDAGAQATVKLATTNTTVPVNRAYLLTSDVDGATQIYLQTREFATGVEDIEAGAKEGTVFYELDGRRASKLQSGRVYVTSEGKSVLVR